MQRLSGLDASFLYLETPSQVMNVSAILQVDPSTVPGGYTFEKMREEIGRRILELPALRRKLADSLMNVDHPVWVEDTDFNIERHVHRVAVPSPGRVEEMALLCSHLVAQQLDRKKPLWDLWIMEGMEGGEIACLLRMHHACVDGATSADILAQLCTPSPEPPELDDEKMHLTAGGATRASMAIGGAANVLRRPVALAKLIPKMVPVPFDWIKRVREGDGMPAPFLVPQTRFNGPLTPARTIALTQVGLDDIKLVKNRFGVKVNDVVLAMAGGALRQYLELHDELPADPLVGLVPVSVRGVDEKDLLVSGTNKVTGMFTRLPTTIADPVERLRVAGLYANQAKEHHGSINANMLRAFAEFAPGNTLAAFMRIYTDRRIAALHPPVFSAVISNVVGPGFPLYFMGGRVSGIYPLGPIFQGLGLNITVFSAEDKLNIGLLSCTDLVPDIWNLADGFGEQLQELVEAATESAAEE